jgi:hypothetical protein
MRLIWKKEWTLLVAMFLTLRLIYSALGMVIASGPDPEPLAGGPIYVAAGSLLHQDQFSHLLINVWERRDTGWYLKVAGFSYSPTDGSIAFQPLLSGLVRGLVALTGGYLLSALLISNLACLAAVILFYEVALGERLSKDMALWATFFFWACGWYHSARKSSCFWDSWTGDG